MQARSLARRCPSGSMTVLGDLAQATGEHAYQDWSVLGEALATGDGWYLEELTIGYRVPREVMEFAEVLGRTVSPVRRSPLDPAGGPRRDHGGSGGRVRPPGRGRRASPVPPLTGRRPLHRGDRP